LTKFVCPVPSKTAKGIEMLAGRGRSRRLMVAALLSLLALASGVEAARGEERSYTIDRPAELSPPLPTVVLLHGGGGSARQIRRYTRFDRLVTRAGFLAVYPNAVAGHWNDGRKSADFSEKHPVEVDDVGFILSIVDDLVVRGLADPGRVFVIGISNGGMMTLRLACERPERLAGIAVVSANLPLGLPCPAIGEHAALPSLFVHGTEDRLVPAAGGAVAPRGRKDRGRVLSVDDTLNLWQRRNGCSGSTRLRLPERDVDDGTRVTQVDYHCAGAPLRHLVVEGGGHGWPGGRDWLLLRWIMGKTSREFEAGEAAWRFWTEN
jgi:polyhydroxybutyrate depolymerase